MPFCLWTPYLALDFCKVIGVQPLLPLKLRKVTFLHFWVLLLMLLLVAYEFSITVLAVGDTKSKNMTDIQKPFWNGFSFSNHCHRWCCVSSRRQSSHSLDTLPYIFSRHPRDTFSIWAHFCPWWIQRSSENWSWPRLVFNASTDRNCQKKALIISEMHTGQRFFKMFSLYCILNGQELGKCSITSPYVHKRNQFWRIAFHNVHM